jgi:hypothetical protein
MARISFNRKQEKVMNFFVALIGLVSIAYIIIIVNSILRQAYLQS